MILLDDLDKLLDRSVLISRTGVGDESRQGLADDVELFEVAVVGDLEEASLQALKVLGSFVGLDELGKELQDKLEGCALGDNVALQKGQDAWDNVLCHHAHDKVSIELQHQQHKLQRLLSNLQVTITFFFFFFPSPKPTR